MISASIVRASSAANRSASAALSSGPRTSDASKAIRSNGSIAGGTVSPSSAWSSAPPILSSSSGSPIGISRGRSRPEPLARTNASVTVRTARLFGSRIRPDARPSGSPPNFAIRPAASESANERWVGIVKTAGCPRAPVRHSAKRLPSGRSTLVSRHRTRAPDGPHRSSGRLRSPGPRRYSLKMALRARPSAAISTRSECR